MNHHSHKRRAKRRATVADCLDSIVGLLGADRGLVVLAGESGSAHVIAPQPGAGRRTPTLVAAGAQGLSRAA